MSAAGGTVAAPGDAGAPGSGSPHVVVVGGGIAGLAAAWYLARPQGDRPGRRLRITVLEGSPATGGKLRRTEVAGTLVDDGAESLLVRRPEGVELATELGLADELVPPNAGGAAVWSRGRLRPLPRGQVMGVPGDLRALAETGVLAPAELARVACDTWLPRTPVDGDVAVGEYVRRRLGAAVVDRLVEPLLGGVYAGHADALSLQATVPQLYAVARSSRSLLRGVAELRARAPQARAEQVFAAPVGGVGRLAERLTQALREAGVDVRVATTVRRVRRTGSGWSLTVGSARDPRLLEADAVVLAVPAHPAARLLADVAPAAATELAGVDYASVGLVTLAYPESAVPAPLRGTGFLVPPVEGRLAKAATFSSRKWGWFAATAPGSVLVRLSVGRAGEARDLQRDDEDLVRAVAGELAEAVGVAGPPLDSRVTRWGGALPQYAVGHVDRIARVRAAVDAVPGLAVCGAVYDGVGIPACIASARAAAARVATAVTEGSR